jgi:DNA-binding NtrC family response regulator
VDDDLRLRRAITRLLSGAGATCHPAGTHAAAVAILDRDPQLDLAILDFQMPDGPVSRLVSQLRSVRPDLLLMGTSGVERGRDFAKCGVTLFIAKPWSLDDLLRIARW